MAANAGTMVLVGRSGRTYTMDMYVPDATGTYLTFNQSGLAGTASPAQFTTPEPCTIVDVSIAAAPTAVGAIFQQGQANINGATIRWANQLAANPNRMKLRIPLPGGVLISGLQF